ncbi:MAG: DUF2760 domain-containing protein [Blastocatellia bacterium]|nr:DUF2760 domain-containing protein [Blastocatellia bacterium]
MQIGLAIKAFFTILFNRTLSDELLASLKLMRQLPAPTGPSKEEVDKMLSDAAKKREEEGRTRAVQLLAILQRDSRLVDFICEDIKQYSDAQVGAAVRTLHEGCQQVLKKYLQLEPIISSPEGEQVKVDTGFDPSTIKLIGNVTGKPPLKGTLLHRGWKVVKVDMPALSENGDNYVVAPAEVEIA